MSALEKHLARVLSESPAEQQARSGDEPTATIEWDCKCGARWKGKVTPPALAQFREAWDEEHQGKGHGPVIGLNLKPRRRKSAGG